MRENHLALIFVTVIFLPINSKQVVLGTPVRADSEVIDQDFDMRNAYSVISAHFLVSCPVL